MPADRRPRRGNVGRLRFDSLERRELLTVQFSSGTYNFGNATSTATVTLVRTADSSATGTEVVQVATTSTGTARADVDYTPIKQNVTFDKGEYTKQVTIPLLDSNITGSTTRTIGLTATSVDSSTTMQSTAQVNLIPHADITPPTVTSTTQLRQKGLLTGFQLTFSKDMDPVQASKTANYVVTGSYTTKSKGFSLFGGSTQTTTFKVPIVQADYDAATRTVTLTVKRLQKPISSYNISNPDTTDSTGTAVPSALKDTSGNLLDVNADGTGEGVMNVDIDSFTRDSRQLNISAAQVKAAKKASANLIAANTSSKKSNLSIAMSSTQNSG